MCIVVGTDFSDNAANAERAAARLAARLDVPLVLVHVVEVRAEEAQDGGRAPISSRERDRLEERAEPLRDLADVVSTRIFKGRPDIALLAVAWDLSARLVVVAASKGGAEPAKALGRNADLIAQRSHVPVLVVRGGDPFEGWGPGPLRLGVCVSFSRSADHAMQWANDLRHFGPCEIAGLHLYRAREEGQRLGLRGAADGRRDPELARALARQLERRADMMRGARPDGIYIEPEAGPAGPRLGELAAVDRADIMVVGSHQRSLLRARWEASVSRAVLEAAPLSVACVPAPPQVGVVPRLPRIERVLAATDFSELGNAAIGLAFAAVARGGTVHLAHVVAPREPHGDHDDAEGRDIFTLPASRDDDARAAADDLRRLIPRGPHTANVAIHVLASANPAEAICQAAARLGVDAVCIASSASDESAYELSALTREVIANAEQPVMLARAVAA